MYAMIVVTVGAPVQSLMSGMMFALSPRNTANASRREDIESDIAHLGTGLTVRGRVDTEGEVHIHGCVQGRIHAARVVLGENGTVTGDVTAKHIRIGGRFSGRIFALDVALEASAYVEGKVFHHNVTVARGAHVDARMPWRPLNYFEFLEQLPEIQP